MVSKRRHKAPKTAPQMKLKTMNDISAATAVKLFHVAMGFEIADDYSYLKPNSEGFPTDFVAKDFFDNLAVYRQWWCDLELAEAYTMGIPYGYEDLMEQRTKLAEFSKTLTEKDLDELFKDAPLQRKILELLRANPDITDKEMGVKIGVETKAISKLVSKLLKRFGSKNRNELAAKLPPPSNPT